MNTDVLEKMRKMRLLGMHRAFKTSIENGKTEKLTADEMTTFLIDSEWDDRHNRSIERGMRNARFRYKSTIEQIDYTGDRGIDKNQIHRFADGSFITKKETLLPAALVPVKASWLQLSATSGSCWATRYFTPMLQKPPE
ncbi:MAG: ATP-binding protein [Chitinophagales bacterium]